MTEERKVYELLEAKISDIHDQILGEYPYEVPLDHPLMKAFKNRWREYLKDIDISFVSKEESMLEQEGRFKVANPLYIEEEAFKILDMSLNTLRKILTLGLP